MTWRMSAMCESCPFAESGAGLHLRKTLRKERWREILSGLRRDQHFICHKTSDETGDGSKLVCAGSLEWSEKHGVSQNFVRVMENLDYFAERRKEKATRTQDRRMGR